MIERKQRADMRLTGLELLAHSILNMCAIIGFLQFAGTFPSHCDTSKRTEWPDSDPGHELQWFFCFYFGSTTVLCK